MKTQGTNGPSLQSLFEAAEAEGALSPAARAVLDVPDLGAQIQAGLGVTVDDVEASEVVLVTIMPDDSGSIAFAGHAQTVRDGHNLVLEALSGSKQHDAILAHNRYLNGTVLYPYCPVGQAIKMTAKNYDPNLGTPLYDSTALLLATVLAKTQEFSNSGVPVRSITLIITDGADEASRRVEAKDVAAVVRDMRASENHIVAGMGIAGGSVSFSDVFRDMGIDDRWILTPSADATEIRKAFLLFSQSAMRVSQGGASFSRTAAGGFGA